MDGYFGKRFGHVLPDSLSAAGMRDAADSPRTISIRIARDPAKKTSFDYEVVARRGGTAIDGGTLDDHCDACSPEDVVKLVDAAVDRQLAALKAAGAPTPSTKPEVEPRAAGASQPAGQPDVVSPRRRRLGKLGIAGAAVLATGAVVGGVGIVIVTRPLDYSQDPNEPERARARSPVRPGIAVAAIGGAAIITGAVLLIVDYGRQRKRRVSWAPSVGPRSAWLTLEGRF
jgi:hypothetical protein